MMGGKIWCYLNFDLFFMNIKLKFYTMINRMRMKVLVPPKKKEEKKRHKHRIIYNH